MARMVWIAVGGLLLGFILGYFAAGFTGGQERYALKDCPGVVGGVYKIDTRTGETWVLVADRVIPVK